MSRGGVLRVLGFRSPTTTGTVAVDRLSDGVEIHRDVRGVPHVVAAAEADAWFGVGFAQGQDRAFQIETLKRAVSGTLAALVGRRGLAVDRLVLRMGVREAAVAQLHACDAEVRAIVEAFAAGVTAGTTLGLRRRPHEFVLLGARPSPVEAADVIGLLALQSFLLASNWDVELARLRIAVADGPEAAVKLDPALRGCVWDTTDTASTELASRLEEELVEARQWLGPGGGSNAWAVAPWRTREKRPLLANDPHLAPVLPSHWYLVEVTTPEWHVAGACLAGTPSVVSGHNDAVAWGVTAGMADNADLFIERLVGDGMVSGPDGPEPLESRTVRIAVRFGRPVLERLRRTRRGPIISPALVGVPELLSLSASWLEPQRIRGLLVAHRCESVSRLRAELEHWLGPSLGVVMADTNGSVGYQLAGRVPRRPHATGLVPRPATALGTPWFGSPVPFDDMPAEVDPPRGFVATANGPPSGPGREFLGADWFDDYRGERIRDLLGRRDDWDVAATMAMQLDTFSSLWRETRDAVLEALEEGPARALLEEWDGDVGAGPAAVLFEVFLAEMSARVVASVAPLASAWALGTGHHPIAPFQALAVRRIGHVARLVTERPDGWWPQGWPPEIRSAVDRAAGRLWRTPQDVGRSTRGSARTVTFLHPLGTTRLLAGALNRGRIPLAGDPSSINQGGTSVLDPLGQPLFVPSLRTALEVGDWTTGKFVLSGGQSGNPCSPHYDDLLPLWRNGSGIPIWRAEPSPRDGDRTLRLRPARVRGCAATGG